MLKKMDSEAEALRTEMFKIVWYMRGGVTIDQAHMLCQKDMKIIHDIIKENIDMTKKSGMPLI
jgi:hypothetical protein